MKILKCDFCKRDMHIGEDYMWGTLSVYIVNEDFTLLKEKSLINGSQHFCRLECLFKEIYAKMEMKNES